MRNLRLHSHGHQPIYGYGQDLPEYAHVVKPTKV